MMSILILISVLSLGSSGAVFWLLYISCDDREWIERIWSHHRNANESVRAHQRWERLGRPKDDPPDVAFFHPTDFWLCVRGTVAIVLGRHDDTLEYDQKLEVAWVDRGYYTTDYGDGRAFEYLQVHGWSYLIGSDGTL